MPVLTAPESIRSDFFRSGNAIDRLMADSGSALLVPPRFEEIADELIPEIVPDNALGFFSSGTSGLPKVHFISREKLHANAACSAPAFGLSSYDRVLILASPWHIAGFTWFAAARQAGASVSIHTPFLDAVSSFAGLIEREKPTVLFAVPTVLHALLKEKLPVIPHIAVGGAPVPVEDFPAVQDICLRFSQAYGQSEAGGLLSVASIASEHLSSAFFRCVGNAPSGVEILCSGTPGDAQPVFAKSVSAVSDTTYDTGDLGWFDSAGRLFIIGRKESGGNCNSLTGISMVLHK